MRWVVLLVGLGLMPSAALADQTDGRSAFDAGVALLQDPDGPRYAEALLLFEKAYRQTQSWKVLGNLGLCYLKLERLGQAVEAYERYLREGGAEVEPAERSQIERDLTTMREQKATLVIEGLRAPVRVRDERGRPDAPPIVNVFEAASATLTLEVAPGRHVVSVDGAQPWVVDVTPGDSVRHRFVLAGAPGSEPASDGREQLVSRKPAYIAGGVTLALGVATGITGVLALGKRSDYHAINGEVGHSRSELESARDSASSMALVSTILGASTIVGAGVTGYLFFSAKPSRGEGEARSRLSPWATQRSAGLLWEGRL